MGKLKSQTPPPFPSETIRSHPLSNPRLIKILNSCEGNTKLLLYGNNRYASPNENNSLKQGNIIQGEETNEINPTINKHANMIKALFSSSFDENDFSISQDPENPTLINNQYIQDEESYEKWQNQDEFKNHSPNNQINNISNEQSSNQNIENKENNERNNKLEINSSNEYEDQKIIVNQTQRITKQTFQFRTITQLSEVFIFEGFYRILIVFSNSDSYIPMDGLLISHHLKNWIKYSRLDFLKEFLGIGKNISEFNQSNNNGDIINKINNENLEYNNLNSNSTTNPIKKVRQVKKILRSEDTEIKIKNNLKNEIIIEENISVEKKEIIKYDYYPFISEESSPSNDLPWIDCITYDQYLSIRLYNPQLFKERYSVIIFNMDSLVDKSSTLDFVLHTVRFDIDAPFKGNNHVAKNNDEINEGLLYQTSIIFFFHDLGNISPLQRKWISSLNNFYNQKISFYQQCTEDIVPLHIAHVIPKTTPDLLKSVYDSTNIGNQLILNSIKEQIIIAILKTIIKSETSHIVVFIPSNDRFFMKSIQNQVESLLPKLRRDSSKSASIFFSYIISGCNLNEEIERSKKENFRLCILVSKDMEHNIPYFDNVYYIIDSGYHIKKIYLPLYHQYTYDICLESLERSTSRSSHCQLHPNARIIRLFKPDLKLQEYEEPQLIYEDLSLHVLTNIYLLSIQRLTHDMFPFSLGYSKSYDNALHNAIEKLIRLNCISLNIHDKPEITALGKMILHINLPVEIGRMLILSNAYDCKDECCYLAAMLLNLNSQSLFINGKGFNDCNSNLQAQDSDHMTLTQILKDFEEQKSQNNEKKWCSYRSINEQFMQHALFIKNEISQSLNFVNTMWGDNHKYSNPKTESLNRVHSVRGVNTSRDNFLQCILQGFYLNIAVYNIEEEVWKYHLTNERVYPSDDTVVKSIRNLNAKPPPWKLVYQPKFISKVENINSSIHQNNLFTHSFRKYTSAELKSNQHQHKYSSIKPKSTLKLLIFNSLTPRGEMQIMTQITNEDWLKQISPDIYYNILSEL